jgi:hypothetical protein
LVSQNAGITASLVIVVIDKDRDLSRKITWQKVVFHQNAVFQGLMPPLDLFLHLGMVAEFVGDQDRLQEKFTDPSSYF